MATEAHEDTAVGSSTKLCYIFLFVTATFFQFYCWNTYCILQKYHHQHWRIEQVFWIESGRLLNHYGLLRAILIRHGSKPILNSVQLQEREMDKWDPGCPKNMQLKTVVSTETCLYQNISGPASFLLGLCPFIQTSTTLSPPPVSIHPPPAPPA